MPAIIRFLGYNPLPAVKGWGEPLVRHRTSLRISQKESAKRLGVDPSTLARWESGEERTDGRVPGSREALLDDEEERRRSASRRAG